MAKKPLHKDVQQMFAERGYELLDEYIGNTVPMLYLCPIHGEQRIQYKTFRTGAGCNKCAIEKNSKMQRLSYEDVKKEFINRGYEILDTTYTNAHTGINYLCKDHGIQRTTWNNFSKGKGCPKCGDKITAGKLRHSYEFVRKAYLDRGYELLDDRYVSNDTPMKFLCPHHGIQSISLSNLLTGYGCNLCGVDSAKDKMKHSYEFIKSEFAKYGYELVSKEYVSGKHPLSFKCPAHGEVISTYGSLIACNGNACLKCAAEKRTGENNGLWKGGTTFLRQLLREYISPCIKESLESSDYTCKVTGIRGGSLEVHHSYAFHSILCDTLTFLNINIRPSIGEYTNDELGNIKDKFMEIHSSYDLLVLSKEIHKLFHDIYGRGDNTPEQFAEFKERYDNGEFQDILRKTA